MNDVEEFTRLVEALRPWRDDVVFVGGWAHRLYREHPLAHIPAYTPLTTKDADIAFQNRARFDGNIQEALLRAGFKEELLGDNRPPVSHYTLGDESTGFYAEFLTPLSGSGFKRNGDPDATTEIAGVTAQKLRHLEVLLVWPWLVTLSQDDQFSLSIPNPVSFIVQKMLIRNDRKPGKQAQDLLYIHDTIELFVEQQDVLANLWREHVAGSLTKKQLRAVNEVSKEMFSTVSDTLRDAAIIPQQRALVPERMRSLCSQVFGHIFG